MLVVSVVRFQFDVFLQRRLNYRVQLSYRIEFARHDTIVPQLKSHTMPNCVSHFQLSLKRLRDSKATKSSGLSVSPVPEQTNGVLQGKNLPPAIKVFNHQNRKIVPNYRGHYHRYYLSGRLQSNNINIARQKILLKARQQQLKQQQSIKTKSAMVISVPIEGTSPSAPSPVASSKVNGNHGDLAKAKANENSESEYSSLEDDDDFAAGMSS